MQELQQEHAEYLAQKKAEALEAVALMEEQVQRKVAQERNSDGEECKYRYQQGHGD